MMRVAVAVLVAVLYLLAPTTAGAQQWRRLDTPNFVVIGDVSARDLRAAGARFEGFREALGSLLGDRLITSVVPAVVVVFSSDGAFNPFKPRYEGKRVEVDGVFLRGRHVNYIAIVNGHEEERQRVLMHEFAHLLVSNSGLEVPLWLNEGLAEYYSTLTIGRTGQDAVVGGLIQDHLYRLNDTKLMTLEELLTISHESPLYNEGSRRSVFYAQSWALAHMLQNGKPSRAKELSTYVQRVSSGMPSVEAWKDAFGDAAIMKELESYIRRLQFTVLGFKLSGTVTSLNDIPASDLSRADADAYLGHLLVQLDLPDDASARLASVEKREPGNVRARVSAALLDQRRNDMKASAAKLTGLAPGEDWLLSYLTGQAMAALVDHALLPPTAETSAAIRAMFEPAVKAGREFPAMASTMAQVELSGAGEMSAETRAALDRARAAAPGQVELQFLHAQALVRGGDFAGAREVLGPLLTPRHPPRVRDMARQLLGRIAERELRPSGSPTGLRIPAAGEQRTEGTLHNIECVVGKGITFHVNGLDGKPAPGTFLAAKFDEVQFVTYRNDLTGSIGCGPLKEAMRVRVVWQPGEGDVKRPVMIEFLAVK